MGIRYAFVILISYLCGSINSSIIVGKLSHGADVRSYGSGNAGITNYLRSFGSKNAFFVLLGDALKCVLPVLLAGALLGFEGKLVSGFFVILGHVFPIYYGFKGGKGVLSSAAFVLVLDYRIGAIALGIFAVIVLFTRYVSLGSVVGVSVTPLLVYLFYEGNWFFVGITALIAVLVVFMHRENIRRLLNGTESRFKLKKTQES